MFLKGKGKKKLQQFQNGGKGSGERCFVSWLACFWGWERTRGEGKVTYLAGDKTSGCESSCAVAVGIQVKKDAEH